MSLISVKLAKQDYKTDYTEVEQRLKLTKIGFKPSVVLLIVFI